MIINWVDVLIGCVIARGIYIGLKSSFFNELFKFLSLLATTVITVHYYNRFALFLKDKVIFLKDYEEVFAFAFIALVMMAIFTLTRDGWWQVFKREPNPHIDKWGGLFFSLCKTYLVCGLIWLGLLGSNQDVLRQGAGQSLSTFFFDNVSFGLYKNFYDGVIIKIAPGEPINEELLKLLQEGIA